MKFIRERTVLLSLLIVLLFFVEACQKDGEKVILENPCSPPCWRQITPGKTNQDELVRILEDMPDVNQRSIQILGPWNIFDSNIVVQLDSNIEVEFYLIKNQVILIAIHDKFDLTYSEAVKHFGDPDVITAARTLGPSRILIGDTPLLYISSMIPSIGIGFGFATTDISMKSDEEIKPDSKITDFDYYDPESFKTLLERGLFTMGNTWDYKYWRSNSK
jgi:hypothetical protein